MKEAFLEPILRKFRIGRVISHILKSSVILNIGCGRKAAFLQNNKIYYKKEKLHKFVVETLGFTKFKHRYF